MNRPKQLQFARAVEEGVVFETGRAVEFRFARNTARAPTRPRGTGDPYQQKLEPAGRYMLHLGTAPEPASDSSGRVQWVTGTVRFEKPLVLRWGNGYDNTSWKAGLVRAYGKKGHALSRALLAAGYDGIVTVTASGATSEIVQL
jgi:hypothetical protein